MHPPKKSRRPLQIQEHRRDVQLKLGATKSNAWRDELVNHQAGDAEDDSRDG